MTFFSPDSVVPPGLPHAVHLTASPKIMELTGMKAVTRVFAEMPSVLSPAELSADNVSRLSSQPSNNHLHGRASNF
jgi:hypothetical protein